MSSVIFDNKPSMYCNIRLDETKGRRPRKGGTEAQGQTLANPNDAPDPKLPIQATLYAAPPIVHFVLTSLLVHLQGDAATSRNMLQKYTDFALFLLLLSNILAAIYAPIQDCDEVFNYWEAAHYLLHGYGLQTWELSPEYSIRSWLYIMVHAIPMKTAMLLGMSRSKTAQFTYFRVVLAVVNTAAQRLLIGRIARTMSPATAMCYLLVACSSAGNFISASSFLPNSFVMYCMTRAMASFIDPRGNNNVADGITWIAAATILGWPFVGLLSLPFAALSLWYSMFVKRDYRFTQLIKASSRALALLGIEIIVDSYFAGHLHSVPFNITFYNVFPGEGRGPDIYGTEPWYFYILNLTLNFNFAFLLAVVALPLALVNSRVIIMPQAPLSVLLSLFYLWLGVMSLPAHKEERFMYPAYPCLAFNAAVSLQVLADFLLRRTSPKKDDKSRKFVSAIDHAISKIPFSLRQTAFGFVLAIIAGLSIWRSAGLTTAYNAPFNIYSQLPSNSSHDLNVCVGKEWYRFPSSFYLPQQQPAHGATSGVTRLKFIRSSFHGLLPGEFTEFNWEAGLGSFPATSIIPPGMNDRNEEDLSKYTSVDQCDYLVDSRAPSWTPNEEELDYISMAEQEKGWRKVACEPFLDAASTSSLARIGWAPARMRTWGDYCLLERVR